MTERLVAVLRWFLWWLSGLLPGPGAVSIAVGGEPGRIHLTFNRPMQSIQLDGPTAVKVAKDLMRGAQMLEPETPTRRLVRMPPRTQH